MRLEAVRRHNGVWASVGLDLGPLLSVFIFSACLSAWVPVSIDLGGLNIRASQLVLPVVLFSLLWAVPSRRLSLWSLITVACGLAWWFSLVAWTLVGSAELGHPAGRVLLMGLNLIQAVAMYLLVVRLDDLRVPLRAFLWSVAALNLLVL